MDIFEENYKDLYTYASNLLYRMPWLMTKGYTAEDIVHETYLSYIRYKSKFTGYEKKKLEQVIKNLLFWTLKDLNRNFREVNSDEYVFEGSQDNPLADSRLFNQELSKAVNSLGKEEAAMFNMRLAGYTYKEINDKFNTTSSQVILDGSMSRIINLLGIDGKTHDDSNRLLDYVKKGISISHMSRETGISSYILTRKLKSLLGIHYKKYSREMQKKKKGG